MIKRSFYLLMYTFPMTVVAWNALAHKIVADIAYQRLTSYVQTQVDQSVLNLHQEYPEVTSFLELAEWPDLIRTQKIDSFSHWHYIDIPFSTDNTPVKNLIDTDNALWALAQAKTVIANKETNPYERARFLAFLAHIVADLHQPLHTVMHFSAKHPNGDIAGNVYFVWYQGERVNLHQLWDEGVGLFVGDQSADHAHVLATAISAVYPENYFGSAVSDLNSNDWAKEGMQHAIQEVYATSEDKEIDITYIKNGQAIAEQQVALAGYRLANLLNGLLG